MADTPEEVADRLCNVHGTHNGAGERGISWCLCRPIEDALREAEARGFAKGLERAAQLLDADAREGEEVIARLDRRWDAEEIQDSRKAIRMAQADASRIRALAPQAPPEVAAAEPKP